MSTQPPANRQKDEFVKPAAPAKKMAAAQSAKAKSASKTKANNANPKANPKAKSQMHRRSRTGCYTCRLRRKKCDEGNPACTACKNLGLICEYKRPMWWSNNDARRQHKDDIKMIIKNKKLAEKAAHNLQSSTIKSPPGLSHSLPTSATFSEPLDRTRSTSIDSQFATPFNFNSPPHVGADFGGFAGQMHPDFVFGGYPSPYEVDVKTERQVFMNDVPTLRESHISTFSTYQTPPPPGTVLSTPFEGGEWTEEVHSERKESLSDESANINFSPGPPMPNRQVAVELDENDQGLLDHFIQFVLPTIFPILDSNQHGSVGSDLILPALQSNQGYLHCCLSIAAQHYKATMNLPGEEIDHDIMRHRYTTISALCEALNRDEDHDQILDVALGLIFFQCVVGSSDDALPDISWHQHFQAAISLVQKLDLARIVSDPASEQVQTPFNMTLTSWIDILGATMQGRAPTFAHTYREKHLSATNPSLGLRELMGCEDRVMYLISEIACLEALKKDGMDDITLCHHVHALGEQIGITEAADGGDSAVKSPFNASGTLSPKQLSKNMTAAYRLAARIYLCSLVPGFNPAQPSCMGLVDKLTAILQSIPDGPAGFDRSLAWVYLIGGGVSLPDSGFRHHFEDRVAELGEISNIGSFGRVASLLREVWDQTASFKRSPSIGSAGSPCSIEGQQQQQQQSTPEAVQYIHWRDVMQMKGWDFLLI